MAPARRHIGASRRKRRDDDGEDEGSLAGDLDDDSLSEGSVGSRPGDEDADGEGSEASDDDRPPKLNGSRVNGRGLNPPARSSSSTGKPELKATVSDTEAMLNGLKVSDQSGEVAELRFDRSKEESQTGRTPSAPPTEPRRETFAARKRREHDKYVKERDQNPAFVPTRGSFFLHDKRTADAGFRSMNKPKSRPVGLIVDGNTRKNSRSEASEGQWAHDLHDTVAGVERPALKNPPASSAAVNPSMSVPTAPKSDPPNRSFSSTTLVGNVPVVIFLPGMTQPIPFPAVPKKQHTRLPQHRPPLRRDKPVRISLPGQVPRYIFPSVERSFIFIPRALRPNQQGYRGRGRGGFYGGGRRPSYYANTVYTPSVLSRRSSLGMAPSQDGYPSPAGSAYSRPAMIPPRGWKACGPPATATTATTWNAAGTICRPAPIPMHQPRPQKAVSVADIETPASFGFQPPRPQLEQPFHHQVPVPARGPGPDVPRGPPSQVSVTPLSQIPERAIHAQPFQPYTYQQGFYPPAYGPGAAFYPPSGSEYNPAYNGPVGPGASVPSFPPGQPPMPYAVPPSSGEQPSQPGTVAHESGGTVYFYDANQMYSSPQYGAPSSGPGGVVGMGGMMTPPGTTYYYPQPPGGGGVYYGPQ
ncbi:hypothetical protein N7474_005303 [Penicillium riverlandense]|uniref:uncharacterized protein n=1 Tax=Penicillium riverlandense TaxID=1903569 RepID=UPI0025493F35|nr:uncharacterized protein N7474_005303 [Penicillium riverlandense]KAJ5819712.1 hypothetical protein N7474_005303 [Penicillium riverlandense]